MKTNTPFRARCVIAFLLSGLVIMIAAALPASGVGKAENEKELQRHARESAPKLQRLARELLGEERFKELSKIDWGITDVRKWEPPRGQKFLKGKIEGDRKIKAAREYISAFPDSYKSFHHFFGYGTADTYWHEGPLRDESIVHTGLYFELFNHADEWEFIRKAVNITIGAGWRHSVDEIDAVYARQLIHHFNTHIDAYSKYLSHDSEATIALLRFFTMDGNSHMNTADERFHHAIVPWGVGELCLPSTRAMKLCKAVDLIDIPLFDDIVAVLECDDEVDGDCAHAAKGGAFQAKLARWAGSNLHLLDAAFESCSEDAMNYLLVFYMMKRYLADKFRILPLLEAKLYINHPKLSMRWLDFHLRDLRMAQQLGKELFSPRNRQERYFLDESRHMGRRLISRFKEYLTVGGLSGTGSFKEASANIYDLDRPLFTNRRKVKELLRHWEAASLPQP